MSFQSNILRRLIKKYAIGTYVFLAILFLLFFSAGYIWYHNSNIKSAEREEVNSLEEISDVPLSDDDHVLGKRGSKVRLTIFFDTNCPFCKILHTKKIPILLNQHPDVEIIYRYYPLKYGYGTSYNDAELLECASRGRGDEVFRVILEHIYDKKPNQDDQDTLLNRLVEEGDIGQGKKEDMMRCVRDEIVKNRIDRDLSMGLRASVSMIPTAVISYGTSSQRIPGASLRLINAAIDRYENQGK